MRRCLLASLVAVALAACTSAQPTTDSTHPHAVLAPTPTATPAPAVAEATPEPGSQHWTVSVRNDSDQPVRLRAARYGPAATMGTLLGWSDPESVPPGEWLDVTLTAPAHAFAWQVFIQVGERQAGWVSRWDLDWVEVYVSRHGLAATGASAAQAGPEGVRQWTVSVRNDSDQPAQLLVSKPFPPYTGLGGSTDPDTVQPGEWLDVTVTATVDLRNWMGVFVRVGTEEAQLTGLGGDEVYVDADGQLWIGPSAAQLGPDHPKWGGIPWSERELRLGR